MTIKSNWYNSQSLKGTIPLENLRFLMDWSINQGGWAVESINFWRSIPESESFPKIIRKVVFGIFFNKV